MPDNDLSTTTEAAQQGDLEVLSSRLPTVEKERIGRALDRFGWNQSAGVRTVMNAFADSPAVQDAVLSHLRAA